ncbi:MAG TPA: DUF4344 domain-containing metallopeptidase [Methylomirabilota bacterium]|nr:DUF4344 domain-containing metallopeptidase [Methylomirabilota bacterium]
MRLRNVAKGAILSVDVEVSGSLSVALVDLDNYRRFPAIDRPLFRGSTDTLLAFSITAPATGTYFVVLDNRAGNEPRAVEVTVRASSAKTTETTRAALDAFERDLKKIFVFEPFPIRVERCGAPQAFAGPAGIVLCTEYADKLYEALRDRAKAGDALLFTLFHELGHTLLAQWKYPFFADEDVADEFATAVMIMLGQHERVRAKAEFFAANPSIADAIAKVFRDDRHPLSPQRARNILRWAKDPELVRKWQPVLVPHMQSALLERLLQRPPSWADRQLIEKELAGRAR